MIQDSKRVGKRSYWLLCLLASVPTGFCLCTTLPIFNICRVSLQARKVFALAYTARRTDTQAQDARRLAGAGWGATCLTFYPPLTLGVRGRLVVIETT